MADHVNLTDTIALPAQLSIKRSRRIPSCTLSQDGLLRLYQDLYSKLEKEVESLISDVEKLPDSTAQELAKLKKSIKDSYKISITVTTANGESIFGQDERVIQNIDSDMEISSLYFSSKTTFQATFGSPPRNDFVIYLDFSKPAIFDITNPVSSPTVNSSSFEVSGQDDTWVRAVYHQINSHFESRKTKRGWLHMKGVYDFFFLIFVVPLIALILARLSILYNSTFPESHIIVDILVGVYGVLILGNLYRLMLGYTRWIFPLVEIKDFGRQVTGRHRTFWALLMMGILASIIATILGLPF